MTKTSRNEKEMLDTEIAEVFYACNIPFAVADHPLFRKCIAHLCPGYQPPSRKAIGGVLFDQVPEKLQVDMKKKIDGKSGTLIEDGWSNVHNEPVVATCLQVGSKVYFLDSHDTGSMPKTVDNGKELTTQSMNSAKERYGCTVVSVVTDNAKNMEKMRDALKVLMKTVLYQYMHYSQVEIKTG